MMDGVLVRQAGRPVAILMAAAVAAIIGPSWGDETTTAPTDAAAAAKPLESGIDLEHFSETVGPGDDFYVHVNEGWLESTEIPPDRSDYGTFTILDDEARERVRQLIEEAAEAAEGTEPGSEARKVGDLFRSVLDTETRDARGLEPIAELLEIVAGIESADQLGGALAELGRRGVPHMLGGYIAPDARRSDTYAVYLSQAGLTLPDRDYYLEDEARYETLREALRDYAADLLSAVDDDDATDAAERIVALETQLATVQWTRVASRDPVKTYNKQTREELGQLLSQLPWDQYAEAAGLDQQEAMIVRQPSFFEGVDRLLADEPLETWRSYLTFKVMDAYAPHLTSALERRHFDFHQTAISGVTEQQPMWKRGVARTNETLGEAVGQLYVERYFPPEAKERMEELVENLKRAFARRIERLDWMTPGTKQEALKKLSQFNTKIGYPDRWKDYTPLEIHADDLVGNLIRASQFEYQRELDKLDGPIDRDEWYMTPQTINAYYSPLMNEIVFPAAILQPPFFNMEADDAVNYGGIGAVIGHELSHGFDDKGSQYDGRGNLRNWWTEEDRQEFERRAQGLVEQFNAYEPIEGMHINGELTLGENIGDLGGLSVAHEAYRLSLEGEQAPVIDSFTGDQRFFIGWSQIWRRLYREQELRRRLLVDPHSPSRYRVIGIVSNMDAFYETFDIGPDDPMYIAPEDRVRIW